MVESFKAQEGVNVPMAEKVDSHRKTGNGRYPDFFPEVPGSIVELRDGIGDENERDFTGRRVLILGTAEDGPVLENVSASTMDEARYLFGDYANPNGTPKDASLVNAFKRVQGAGADNIELMRISGEQASNELPLTATVEEKVHEHTVTAVAEGNAETTISLELSVESGYDDVRLGDVSVIAGDKILSAAEFDVDEDNHEITVHSDVANDYDEISIEYEERQIEYVNPIEDEDEEYDNAEELADAINSITKGEYELPHTDIFKINTLEVELSEGSTVELDSSEYDLTAETGLLIIYDIDTYQEIHAIDYEYKQDDITEHVERKPVNARTQTLELSHKADTRRPIIIRGALNGEYDNSDDEIDVIWDHDGTSEILIDSGVFDVSETLTIDYYWVEEELVEESVYVSSLFGGSKYNNVKIIVEDVLAEIEDNEYFVVEDEVHTDLSNFVYLNEDNIQPDSLYLTDDVDEDLLGEDTDGNIIGAYVNDEEFTKDPDVDETDFIFDKETSRIEFIDDTLTEITATYAYEDGEAKKTSTKRGIFNPGKTEEGNLGGGHYQDFRLNVSEDRETVHFPAEHILPDYFEKEDNQGKLVFHRQDGEEVVEKTMADYLEDTDKDFEIDYGQGVIEFEQPLSLNEEVECEEFRYYNMSSKKITIHPPEGLDRASNSIEVTGIGSEITNLAQLVDALNSNPYNEHLVYFNIKRGHKGRSALDIKTPEQKLMDWDEGQANPKVIRLSGGRDEIDLNAEQLYEKLEEAYDVAKDIEEIDIVLPAGAYADTELLSNKKDFAQQLANFCAHTFLRNNEIQGVIGTEPLQYPSKVNVIEKIENLINMDTDYYMQDSNNNTIYDNEGNPVDIGRFISVIGYDKSYEDERLAIPSIESGAADFVGIASMLESQNSPTNEVTANGQLAFQISTYQSSRLINNKIVPARVKKGTPKILDAMTCAQPNSGWTRWYTVDIVFDTINDLRSLYDRYIGKANEFEQRSSLDAEIRQKLDIKPTVIAYDYNINIDPTDPEMGSLVVELELVPAAELQRIKTVVSINQSLQAQM